MKIIDSCPLNDCPFVQSIRKCEVINATLTVTYEWKPKTGFRDDDSLCLSQLDTDNIINCCGPQGCWIMCKGGKVQSVWHCRDFKLLLHNTHLHRIISPNYDTEMIWDNIARLHMTFRALLLFNILAFAWRVIINNKMTKQERQDLQPTSMITLWPNRGQR